MGETRICPNCLAAVEGFGTCPLCGYAPGDTQKIPDAKTRGTDILRPGTVLNGWMLGGKTASSPIDVTYRALHIQTGERRLIREYFPRSFTYREPGGDALSAADPARETIFLMAVRQYLNAAAKAGLRSFFFANNTVYVVLPLSTAVQGLPNTVSGKRRRRHPVLIGLSCGAAALAFVVTALGVLYNQYIAGTPYAPGNLISAVQYRTAENYYKLSGGKDNEESRLAVQWLQSSANAGNKQAEYSLGVLYLNGNIVKKDDARAFGLLSKSAKQEDAAAQYALGYCYEKGIAVAQNYANAAIYYQKAADQGNSDAQDSLGHCYDTGKGLQSDYIESLTWYQKSADQGNAMGESDLAACYYYGDGVPIDYDQAFSLYQASASQGCVSGETGLATCYLMGNGVGKSKDTAYGLLKKAAASGDPYGESQLAQFDYAQGDYADAAALCTDGAQKGDDTAELYLGCFYVGGTGVPRDLQQAAYWLGKSADQHNRQATVDMGDLCFYGGLGKPDYKQAYEWYLRAIDYGSPNPENLYKIGEDDNGNYVLRQGEQP